MTRQEAAQLLRNELDKHDLRDWCIRLNQNADSRWLGICLHRDRTIALNAHHIDIHPDPDIINTIRHEVAHAIVGPGHGHDDTWAEKAREIGCDNTLPCSNLSLTPEIIDAIRSGATVEVTYEEQIIRTPKYKVTRLQDKCPYCGKVAKTRDERIVHSNNDTSADMKFIYLECGHTLIKPIPKGTPFHTFQFGGDANCDHDWDKNECKKCGRYRPYDFQIEGMKRLEAALAGGKGGGCFDDMGLGKTIQAEGVVFFHPETWPVLWVVKSGLKYQFAVSIINWMGPEHAPQIIESSTDWLIPGLKHYIVSYDMLVPKVKKMKKSGKTVTSGFDIKQFDRIGIKLVVLDECQQIKNVDSSRTQMVRQVVKNRQVIATSGTPWNNRGTEFYPVLNMLDPIKFYSEEHFKKTWVETYWHGNQLKVGGIKNIEKFREFTKDLIFRRERSEVLPELPSVTRTKLYVKMDLQQEQIYDAAVEEFVTWYQEQAENISGIHILAAMAKMRHLAAVIKIPVTREYIDDFVDETDRKLVVFAHHQDVQADLYEYCKETYGEEMYVDRIVAQMDPEKRFQVQEKFNNSKRAILIASMLAAGEGLNLQTCADCLMHERQWNPGKEEQPEGRFIRIGQTADKINAVYTHLQGLLVIDGQLDGIVERKRVNYHNSMNKTELQGWSEDSFARELAESIVRAYNAKKNKEAA